MRYHEPPHLSCDAPPADPVRLAASAYLARFTGSSREHTESDLRCYLRWCADRGLDPLAARRPDLEQYIRWMQEACRFKPSTISRRFSVAAGFYRTCVIDAVLEHSPADHVRRPNVPPESPTLGFTHLQFEALLTAAREPASDYDFALVAMLGLLGLRIFEATGADIADRTSGPILLNSRGARMDRHAATRRLRHLARHAGVRITRPHPHMLRHTFVTTMLDAGVGLRDVQIAARHADPRTTMRQVGPATTSTATPTTSSPPTWPPAPDPTASPVISAETSGIADERACPGSVSGRPVSVQERHRLASLRSGV